MKNRKGNRLLLWPALVLLAAAVVLAALPSGVKMTFSNGTGESFAYYYAYFSPMPLAYGNFFPLLCGLLTVGLTAVTLVLLLRNRRETGPEKGLKIATMVDVALAAFAMLLVGSYTVIGVILVVLLLAVAVLEFLAL